MKKFRPNFLRPVLFALLFAAIGSAFTFSLISSFPAVRKLATTTSLLPSTSKTADVSSGDEIPITEYRLENNVDQCTINNYSAQGWRITAEGTLENISSNCKASVLNNGFDWVLFQRP